MEKKVFEMVTSSWDILFKCHPWIGKSGKKKKKGGGVRKLPTQVEVLFNWDIEYLLRSRRTKFGKVNWHLVKNGFCLESGNREPLNV